MSGRLKALVYGTLALMFATSAFAISMSAELRACRSLAPAVQEILGQHERVRDDLVALEVELRTLLDAPQQVTRPELVAMIEASATIRAGLR